MEKIIRPLENSDLPELSKFFSRLTTLDRGPKFVNWFYLLQAKGFLSQGAFINGSLVGSISVVDRIVKLESGENINCGLSIHALIDPQFKEVISIMELSRPLYKRCAEKGMKAIFGFPNKNFYFIQEKIDKFKEIQRFNALILKSSEVSPSDIEYHFKLLDDVYSISYQLGRFYGDSLNGLISFHRSLDEYLVRTHLNPESLYQFHSVVENGVEIGLIVLKYYTKDGVTSLHLVDYFIPSHAILENVVKSLLQKFQSSCTQFVFWSIEKHLKDILVSCKFEESGFETYFGCKNLSLNEADFEKIKNINNWHLSMIDSDVF